ncbi:MAG: histidine phosphatase family protein [Dehalococcoidales bacterium]|nr:histidine phosphatase family protein [Dehalococcoidales bacterium]MDZ4230604.1 histidine phosphatase family protein [Dehalococcoidales bacterium]
MVRLLLVRHGISEYNSARRFAGYSDVEMSAAGYEQVKRLRDRLAVEKIDAVYSSDLRRAQETAQVISTGCDTDIISCPELREVNYGEVEGLTFQQIKDRYPALAESISEFNLQQINFPGGETFEQFIARTITFLDKLEKHEPSQTVLIVAHGGPLRVLFCHLMGIDQLHWRKFRVDNASLSIIETYPQRVVVSLLNDTSHLREVHE